MPEPRTLLQIAALAGTFGAVAWVNGYSNEEVAPAAYEQAGIVQRGPAEIKPGSPEPELRLAALDSRNIGELKTDIFTNKSWYVPPPVTPQPPPKPTAPPLPFTFLGRMIENGVAVVFVSNRDSNQVVRVGEVVDRVWRVDAIEATRMVLTYLPLNETKYLILGSAP